MDMKVYNVINYKKEKFLRYILKLNRIEPNKFDFK